MSLGVVGTFEAADTMALETDCICPRTSVANDVIPDDLQCRGRRYRTTSPRVMLLASIAPRPVLTCAMEKACPLVPLTSQLDDRSLESGVAEQKSRNATKRGQSACLSYQATPSVREKASSQQTEASLDQSGQQNSVHNILRRLADLHQIAAKPSLGSSRLITRCTTPTDLLLL